MLNLLHVGEQPHGIQQLFKRSVHGLQRAFSAALSSRPMLPTRKLSTGAAFAFRQPRLSASYVASLERKVAVAYGSVQPERQGCHGTVGICRSPSVV